MRFPKPTRSILALCVWCGLLDFSLQADPAAMRTWTNAQGRTLQGAYARLVGADVEITLADGKIAKVPLASLSPADQEHVASLQPKPEPPVKIPDASGIYATPVPPEDTRGVFAVDAGDFTVSFNDPKARQLDKQALRELIQPLQAAAWALRELHCGCDPIPGSGKPQARFITRDVMNVSADQAERGYWRIPAGSFALEVAWNETASPPSPAPPPSPARPAGGEPGTADGVSPTPARRSEPPPPQFVGNPVTGASAANDRAAAEQKKYLQKETRTANLIDGGIRLMLREDALFLPGWVMQALSDSVQALPREEGWPQAPRFRSGLHRWLTAFSKTENANPAGSFAADALAAKEEIWQDHTENNGARARLNAGALLLGYYFMRLDYGSGSMWKSAVADARADGAKLRAFFSARDAYRDSLLAYMKSRGIIPRADGSFSYFENDPPPAPPADPFPEAKSQGVEVLKTRHSAKFVAAFDKQEVAKIVDDAFAKDHLPLGAAFVPYQAPPSALAEAAPTQTPLQPVPPVPVAGANVSIVTSAKRVPVDNRTWPLQIKVGLGAVNTAVVDGRYRCGRFEFSSDVPLPPPVAKEVSRTFTAVEELIQQLPWGITPTPAKGAYFQARLFSTRERYERDGGPTLSGGFYDQRDKIFRVPFESLGLVASGSEITKRKGFHVDTIIHELTHMMMDEMLRA
jgi:hypothetical protein